MKPTSYHIKSKVIYEHQRNYNDLLIDARGTPPSRTPLCPHQRNTIRAASVWSDYQPVNLLWQSNHGVVAALRISRCQDDRLSFLC